MSDLADACAELARWLPAAQALTTQPDTQPHAGRSQPSSRPPWNGAAADALLDAVEGARQLEAAWRSGRLRPIAATGSVLASIVRLSYAETEGEQRQAVILVSMWTRSILQLPAIDREERPQQIPWPCPYCGFRMVRLYPKEGEITCLRYGACFDSNGQHPKGLADRNRLNGEPQVTWRDGLVT